MQPTSSTFPLILSALLLAAVAIAACGRGADAGNAGGDVDGTCGTRKDPLVGSSRFVGACAEYRGDVARAVVEADCAGPERQGQFLEGSCGDFHGPGGCVLSDLGGTVALYEVASSCEERDGCRFNDHVCTAPDLGLIRFRGQLDYATASSRAALS